VALLSGALATADQAEDWITINKDYCSYSGDDRPGPNLYTDSVIAVNAATGELNWFYQAIPHDEYDWDLGTPPTLYRAQNGADMLAIAGKDGHVYGLDRGSQALVFKTPATMIANADAPPEQTPKLVCPGALNHGLISYSVLTYPRCINCHPGPTGDPATDYPRQADDRHPHYYGVVRGAETDNEGNLDNKGRLVGRCETCHGTENNPTTGIPGAKHEDGTPAWQLAPKEMAWESAAGNPLTGAELCAQLKDPARNGDRDLEALLDHMKNEPLVLWGWNPGTRPNGKRERPLR
jgi:hypothetical protein